MRSSGPHRLLVYCGDYKCAHSVVIDVERWADDVRLSDLEPRFGHRGADVRPLFDDTWAPNRANSMIPTPTPASWRRSNAAEAVQGGRIHLELINAPFLEAGGTTR
jgi:hypothetical protein